MALALGDNAIQDFLSRHPVSPEMVGRYGIAVRDGNTWVLVYNKAGGLGFLNVTSQSDALGFSNMADGEVRQVQPKKGAVDEVGILDIVAQIPGNITVDSSLLTSGAKSVSEFIAAVANETGKDLGAITGGVSQGLFNVSVFGIPLPVLAFILAAGYIGFLALQSGVLKVGRR